MAGALKIRTSTSPDVWTVIGGGSFATDAETIAGTIDDKAVTPAGLAAYGAARDVMWVGPDAPTDPQVEMWWDTDEPGLSPLYVDAQTFGVSPGASAATNRTGINAALAAAGAGGTVLLPQGTLDTDASIVAAANTTLQGHRNGTTIRATGPGAVITITNVVNFTLSDLTVDGNRSSVADDGTTVQHGIYILADNATGCPGTKIRRVKVLNAWDRGIRAQATTLTTNPLDLDIVDCEVAGSVGAGMFLQNSQRTLVEGCDVHHNDLWGIHVVGGTNATIRRNRAHDQTGTSANRGHGIVVNTGCVGVTVTENECYNNTIGPTTWGIVIGINTSRFVVANNRCYNNSQNMTIDVADTVTNPVDTRGVVANNICTGATVGNGLHFNQVDGMVISGNHCAYNTQWGMQIYGRNCTVVGNTSHHNGRSGIAFSQDLTPPLTTCGPHFYGPNNVYANNTSAGAYTDLQIDALTNGIVNRTGYPEGSAPSLMGKTGEYWSYPGTKSTVAVVAGNMYTHAVYVPSTITLDRIAAEITVLAAGSTLSLGIYNDDGNGDPGTLLLDAGTISGAAVAVVELTINQVLQGGRLYHFAILAQGGAPTTRALTSSWFGRGATLATAFTAIRIGRLRGSVVGTALPNPAATTANNSPQPFTAVRIA